MPDAFLDLAADFGPFDGRIWLSCAHQGPLPRRAAEAARRAIDMKVAPFALADSRAFNEVPRALRAALGRLAGVPGDDVILGNSTSYGLNLVANGLDWREGDEVLLVRGDFPATIFAWLPLAERGIAIRFIDAPPGGLTADALDAHCTPRTRLFCTNWVHSFTGAAVDAGALAEACRARGVVFVLNGSQGIGQRPFDAIASGVDAVTSCGFKWLLGPYATGFCWIRPALRESMRSTQGYWLANLTADDLRGDVPERLRDDLGARRFDVFCPANFFSFMAWTESVRYLLEIGVERVAAHDLALAQRLLDGLDRGAWHVTSPETGPRRTAIVVFRHRDEARTAALFERLRDARIDVSLRRGAVRVAPHLHNGPADVDALLEVANG